MLDPSRFKPPDFGWLAIHWSQSFLLSIQTRPGPSYPLSTSRGSFITHRSCPISPAQTLRPPFPVCQISSAVPLLLTYHRGLLSNTRLLALLQAATIPGMSTVNNTPDSFLGPSTLPTTDQALVLAPTTTETVAATASGIESADDGGLETLRSAFDDENTMQKCTYVPCPSFSSVPLICINGAPGVEALWERESGYVHSFFVSTRYVR